MGGWGGRTWKHTWTSRAVSEVVDASEVQTGQGQLGQVTSKKETDLPNAKSWEGRDVVLDIQPRYPNVRNRRLSRYATHAF